VWAHFIRKKETGPKGYTVLTRTDPNPTRSTSEGGSREKQRLELILFIKSIISGRWFGEGKKVEEKHDGPFQSTLARCSEREGKVLKEERRRTRLEVASEKRKLDIIWEGRGAGPDVWGGGSPRTISNNLWTGVWQGKEKCC